MGQIQQQQRQTVQQNQPQRSRGMTHQYSQTLLQQQQLTAAAAVVWRVSTALPVSSSLWHVMCVSWQPLLESLILRRQHSWEWRVGR
jgi:hypothetical protein